MRKNRISHAAKFGKQRACRINDILLLIRKAWITTYVQIVHKLSLLWVYYHYVINFLDCYMMVFRQTFSIDSSFRLVDDLPESTLYSTEVRRCFKNLYHFLVCILPVESLPKVWWLLEFEYQKVSSVTWCTISARCVWLSCVKIKISRACIMFVF